MNKLIDGAVVLWHRIKDVVIEDDRAMDENPVQKTDEEIDKEKLEVYKAAVQKSLADVLMDNGAFVDGETWQNAYYKMAGAKLYAEATDEADAKIAWYEAKLKMDKLLKQEDTENE